MKLLVLLLQLSCISFVEAAVAIRPEPDEWSLTIRTSAPSRHFQYVTQINCAGRYGTEIVVRYGDSKHAVFDYEKLYVGKLDKRETDMVWTAFKSSLAAFILRDPTIKALDGGYVEAELRVGSRALRISYANLSDTSESSPELNRVIKMVERRIPADKFRGRK